MVLIVKRKLNKKAGRRERTTTGWRENWREMTMISSVVTQLSELLW
jgi:hypothetical protein